MISIARRSYCGSRFPSYQIALDQRSHQHRLVRVPGRHGEPDLRPLSICSGGIASDLIGSILAAPFVVTEVTWAEHIVLYVVACPDVPRTVHEAPVASTGTWIGWIGERTRIEDHYRIGRPGTPGPWRAVHQNAAGIAA